MAVKIADQIKLRQENFLDDRQGLATSTDILLNWDFTKIPIPEGFQVFLLGDWYIYKSSFTPDNVTGYFRKYSEDLGIKNIEEIEEDSIYSRFDLSRCYTAKFSDILDPLFWVDSLQINHARPGKIVTIIDDNDNNGVWILLDFDYTNPENWHRIPCSWRNETINGTWTFADATIFSRDLIAKHISFGDNSYVDVDTEGKATAKFDKIIAEASDIQDIDSVLESKIGLFGIGNLLVNTSFEGQHNSRNLTNETNLHYTSEIYSDKKEGWSMTTRDWTIIEDPSSVTGYILYLPDSNSEIAQESLTVLVENSRYVLSWKQRGKLTVMIDGVEIEPIRSKVSEGAGEDDLIQYYYKINTEVTKKISVRFIGGPGYLCEVKLESGLVPTTWSPSFKDTDPVADITNSYEFLKTAFKEYSLDGTVSSLFLKNQIKVGDIANDQVESIYGGLSGIFSSPEDIMLWSGSTYEKAQDLIVEVMRNPNYLDRLSYPELQKLTKLIITFNYKTIMTDLYAVGKFKGEHLDYNGNQMRSFDSISGNIPCFDGSEFISVKFNCGILDVEKYDDLPTNIKFYEEDGTNYTELEFQDGRLVDRSDVSYKIWVGNEINSEITHLCLRFHDGYLVKVSQTLDNSTYYWY